MYIKVISSAQNALIKDIQGLHKARDRKKLGLFLVEGIRETGLAIASGYPVRTLLFCPELLPEDQLQATLPGLDWHTTEVVALSRALFNSLAYRKDLPNVLALCQLQPLALDHIFLRPDPLILVVESVEKPGNLGAMLRTADAADLDAVIVCDPQTDPYNPNVLRSSVGCFFTRQVATASTAETIAWLRAQGIQIFATSLASSQGYHTCDYRQGAAIIMGTEATGLSGAWLQAADARIKIPMRGQIDSMNVSNSAAILIYEALRQRGFGEENGETPGL